MPSFSASSFEYGSGNSGDKPVYISRYALPCQTNTLSNKVGEFQPQATVDYEREMESTRYYPLRFCASAELLVKRRYSCIETPEVIFLMPLPRLTQ